MAKALTCKWCGRKFHKGKTNTFGRLSRHQWKEHPDEMKKRIKAGQRKAKKKKDMDLRPIDKEFMAIDDILLALTGNQQQSSQPYNAQHEQLGGLLLEAIVPIAISAITAAVQKRRSKK